MRSTVGKEPEKYHCSNSTAYEGNRKKSFDLGLSNFNAGKDPFTRSLTLLNIFGYLTQLFRIFFFFLCLFIAWLWCVKLNKLFNFNISKIIEGTKSPWLDISQIARMFECSHFGESKCMLCLLLNKCAHVELVISVSDRHLNTNCLSYQVAWTFCHILHSH